MIDGSARHVLLNKPAVGPTGSGQAGRPRQSLPRRGFFLPLLLAGIGFRHSPPLRNPRKATHADRLLPCPSRATGSEWHTLSPRVVCRHFLRGLKGVPPSIN